MLTRMRRIALGFAVLVIIAGCGKSGSETSSSEASSSTSTSAPAVVPGAAFPDNIPTDSDGECSLPRTDPARPKAGPLGKITDGVEVSQVDVSDEGPGSVIVDFTVSSPPYVNATSGERWVVVKLDGVRRFGHAANINSAHARRLPASVCDDSSWAFAFSFDREIDRLELENDAAPRLRVFLKS
jgi:hypothetical protein